MPFALIQPAGLPAGLVLQGGLASPPPPEVKDGVWTVRLFYGPPSVVVWERWRATGLLAVIPPPGGKVVQLTAHVRGELAEPRDAAQVDFSEGGRAYTVTGPRSGLPVLLQVARSLAAAARSVRGPNAGIADSIPVGAGWMAGRPAVPWPVGTVFTIVPAQTVPGGTGSCAGNTFRYSAMFLSSPSSGQSGPVSGSGGIAAYNPRTCQVVVATTP